MTDSLKYFFSANYPSPSRFPWFDNTLASASNLWEPDTVINFSINTALIDLLPKKFSRIQTLKPDELIESYIHWYCKRFFRREWT